LKRFWKLATVALEGGRFAIRLDGRPMRLPGGPVLLLESEALAEAIAAEWQAVEGTMSAEDVPLTQLAGTAQERVARDPAGMADALAKYGESDLLCYRAEGPEALVALQEERWQPWLAWAEARFGARLVVTQGVMPVAQPHAARAALQGVLAGLSAPVLAGLGSLVPAMGSLVLGLAVAEGTLAPEQAFELAFLDEIFQARFWGEDDLAASRREAVAKEIFTASRFIRLSTVADAASRSTLLD
jgi:chaperone required for assembly of F1-ATPase